MTAASAPARRASLTRRTVIDRVLLYGVAILLALWTLVPIYLIALAAFSKSAAVYEFPKSFLPTQFSTETMSFFVNSTGVLPSVKNSIIVALGTIVLSLSIGAPAGYALARFRFPGRDMFHLAVLSSKMFPIAILSIPLAVAFITLGLYDTLLGVVIIHSAMVLPFVVIVTAGVFYSVSRELEEAAMTLGTSRFGAFMRVALPLALPGLAAAAIFAFVSSWNEVFAATILTVRERTLPAHILATLNQSPLYFRFAGGFFMIIPSLFFIFFMRKYLFNLWGPGR
ncbi:MAG TPA: carbohydrate ABC transporter permease [Candidatus Limnocylindria bacterium]|jgi:multiple sugar transport system permease protein|nr:carbohydrate ABC transporter permease [Candidatus Limnocylindria bacterium]